MAPNSDAPDVRRYSTCRGDRSLMLWLLGGFRVQVGHHLVWGLERSSRAPSVLKMLTLARGHRVHREAVIDLLWPDLSDEAGLNNLHRTLFHLRQMLEPSRPPRQASAFVALE